MENKNHQQIAGAIVLAGIIIAGAVLLKGTGTPVLNAPKANTQVSKQLGLNVRAFDTCLASGKFKDKVQADIESGTAAGVNGTPSSFILVDGIVVDTIPGAQSYETVIQKVAAALDSTKQPQTDKKQIVQIKPVSPSEHILGNIDAKIIIVEYSDLDCPFCKTFHNTMHQVVEKSNGDVAWVYRHYPIPQLHPNAFKKAEETECAWEQKGNDAFWKYTDRLFEINSK